MSNEERSKKIEGINTEILGLSNEWIYLSTIIQNNAFSKDDNVADMHKRFNELDNKRHGLINERRSLQTPYYVEFLNDSNILDCRMVLLNTKVDLDTKKNGWEIYMKNDEARSVLLSIHHHLCDFTNRPQVNHIITNPFG